MSLTSWRIERNAQCSLLQLPQELRDQIWGYVLGDRIIHLEDCAERGSYKRAIICTAIMLDIRATSQCGSMLSATMKSYIKTVVLRALRAWNGRYNYQYCESVSQHTPRAVISYGNQIQFHSEITSPSSAS